MLGPTVNWTDRLSCFRASVRMHPSFHAVPWAGMAWYSALLLHQRCMAATPNSSHASQHLSHHRPACAHVISSHVMSCAGHECRIPYSFHAGVAGLCLRGRVWQASGGSSTAPCSVQCVSKPCQQRVQ